MEITIDDTIGEFFIGLIFCGILVLFLVIVTMDYLIESGRLSRRHRISLREYSEGPPEPDAHKYNPLDVLDKRELNQNQRYLVWMAIIMACVFVLDSMDYIDVCIKAFKIWTSG